MFIDNDIKLDFNDVLIIPKRSKLQSRKDVNLIREITFLHSKNKFVGIPIIASNMDGVGTFEMHKALSEYQILTCICKHYTLSDWNKNKDIINTDYIIASIGTRYEDFKKVTEIIKIFNIKYVCIDVANGYSEDFIRFVTEFRKSYPHITIFAGNVCTKEITEALILAGVDVVKTGIGNGLVCKTRIVAGVGQPQLSTIIETSNYAHGLNAQIIGDGGYTNPSDINKAFAAGSDFVMIGSMFAGHDEGEQEIIIKYKRKQYLDDIDDDKYEKKLFVEFYGMSSKKAQNIHNGQMEEYRASEGREVLIPYKGKIDNTIKEILGGLRSCCTYVGAKNLKDLSKCTTFIRVNRQINNSFEKYEY